MEQTQPKKVGAALFSGVIMVLILSLAGNGFCATLPSTQTNISLKKEISHSKALAFKFLKIHQKPDGSWSNADFPAISGLVLYAFFTSSDYHPNAHRPEFIQKGLDYIESCAKNNGGIYKEELANYNTAISLMALTASGDPKYYPIILKARRYVISLQDDRGQKGATDNIYDGGIGYGDDYVHSDLSNTYTALEALRTSEFLESDRQLKQNPDLKNLPKKSLNWKAAIKFVERCQNLSAYNDQAWASDDPKNKGGFVYFPGNSKAGEEKLPGNKVALRSYGSMTYAGLLSFIYAKLDKDDPRVKAAYAWVCKNYTLNENPGLGQQGLFYYYNTMAKALSVMKVDHLAAPNGSWIDWRKDMARKLIEKQKGNGSWVNENGRFWESDPVLVTAYSLIVMNIVAR
jgi:squalene-hopene/tetraprenyl-beta-curcumene cyclase